MAVDNADLLKRLEQVKAALERMNPPGDEDRYLRAYAEMTTHTVIQDLKTMVDDGR